MRATPCDLSLRARPHLCSRATGHGLTTLSPAFRSVVARTLAGSASRCLPPACSQVLPASHLVRHTGLEIPTMDSPTMDSGNNIPNRNTEWAEKYPGVLWCYVLMVFMAKWFLGFWFTPDVAWTTLACVHGVV